MDKPFGRDMAALAIAVAMRNDGRTEDYVKESLAIVTGDEKLADIASYAAFHVPDELLITSE